MFGLRGSGGNELHSGNYHEEAARYDHLILPRSDEERATRLAAYTEAKSRAVLFNGVKELLEELHQSGRTLIVNTNAYEKMCIPLLKNAGVYDLFDFVATADISKDKVEKFRIIAERYGLTKDEMVFVTDALGDVRDADAAGVTTIAVTWGVHDASYFSREPHENLKKIVATIDELKAGLL